MFLLFCPPHRTPDRRTEGQTWLFVHKWLLFVTVSCCVCYNTPRVVKLTNMRITAAVILFGFMDFIMLWVLLFGSETSCFLADQGAGGLGPGARSTLEPCQLEHGEIPSCQLRYSSTSSSGDRVTNCGRVLACVSVLASLVSFCLVVSSVRVNGCIHPTFSLSIRHLHCKKS